VVTLLAIHCLRIHAVSIAGIDGIVPFCRSASLVRYDLSFIEIQQMFTGLVEGLGRIAALETEAGGLRIVVQPPSSMGSAESANPDPARIGDSVAINGCCLTVIAIEATGWSFQAGQETLSKTNLGKFRVGDSVNLERSLAVNGRLGGHFVQGHVDGLGTVVQRNPDADWITMGFEVAESLADLMVPKGSVCVDGVSLTVVTVDSRRFTVALIPHTLTVTTLGQRALGQTVNIETDILGKYARKFLVGPG
jgi:riboflavin synthase